MKQFFLLQLLCFSLHIHAQNVGIGTTTPTAGLHIVNENGIIAKGNFNTGAVIDESGEGSRLIFNPRKGAIRGGHLDAIGAAYWNDASTGLFSTAFGQNVKATSMGTLALGQEAWATGFNSTAIGYACRAEVANSIAISGVGSEAKDQFTIAIGNYTYAHNYGSIALGRNVNSGYPSPNFSSNSYAIGMGDHTKI